ncbi:MAG: hypothetical protein J6M22_04105 [Firmicutes bacterium]|nr:hypothetical protein [Bacillota bacterium]
MAKKKKFYQTTVSEFLSGRYGFDELSKIMIILSMILMVVSVLVTYNRWIYLVAIIILGIGYWRMCSKNIKKRKAENDAYLKLISGFSRKARTKLEEQDKAKKYSTFEMHKELGEDGETVYAVYTCRGCGKVLRFEENQGLVKIICPECKNELLDRI